MKLASLAFFVLLALAHAAGDFGEMIAQPLSLFRDGAEGWLGYWLFALMLLIGLLYTVALARSRREAEAAVSGLAVLLLLLVGVTPSNASFHLLCSLVLLLLLYGYYALLLRRAESPWLIAHLVVPVALALATRFPSYGLWQKSFIGYFVVAAVLHHHVLGREPERSEGSYSGPRVSRRGQPIQRRRVYRVEPGREWTRSRVSRS
jgi:hypothetical protein